MGDFKESEHPRQNDGKFTIKDNQAQYPTEKEKEKSRKYGVDTKETITMDDKAKEFFAKNFREYSPQKVNIEEVVAQNKITEDDRTLNTRTEVWGNSYKDYKFNESKYKEDILHPILITKKNGKYLVDDGMHRLVAMQNAGYKIAEILVREI